MTARACPQVPGTQRKEDGDCVGVLAGRVAKPARASTNRVEGVMAATAPAGRVVPSTVDEDVIFVRELRRPTPLRRAVYVDELEKQMQEEARERAERQAAEEEVLRARSGETSESESGRDTDEGNRGYYSVEKEVAESGDVGRVAGTFHFKVGTANCFMELGYWDGRFVLFDGGDILGDRGVRSFKTIIKEWLVFQYLRGTVLRFPARAVTTEARSSMIHNEFFVDLEGVDPRDRDEFIMEKVLGICMDNPGYAIAVGRSEVVQ